MITINLNKQTPPKWFVNELAVMAGQTIVALDDDAAIHGVWRERFKQAELEASGICLKSYTSGSVLKEEKPQACVYLMDYELLGQKETGLDIIETLGLQEKAVLVTSRYDEKKVVERCLKLGVGLIPKSMAATVPIRVVSNETVTPE